MKEERVKSKDERGKRKEERGKRKEERGKRKGFFSFYVSARIRHPLSQSHETGGSFTGKKEQKTTVNLSAVFQFIICRSASRTFNSCGMTSVEKAGPSVWTFR